MFNLKKFRRAFARRLIGNRFDLAYHFCKGSGIEIGAMSSPYLGFSSSTKVQYADIFTSSKLRSIISSLNVKGMYKKEIVNTDILLKAPSYSLNEIIEEKVDFIYSSNVFEHSSNPIFSLLDQLKSVVIGGIVYLVVPNKKNTYDRNRSTTSIKILVEKYEENIFTNSINEALDVIINTDVHPVYDLYKKDAKKYAKDMIEKKEGIHHYYTYELTNILELLNYAKKIQNFEILYVSADVVNDMHIALKRT